MLKVVGQNLSFSLLIQALNIASGILLARELGPQQRGALVAIIIIPTFLAAIASLGLVNSATYWGARDDHTTGSLLVTLITLAVPLSIIAMIAGVLLIGILYVDRGAHVRTYALLYLLFIPFNMITVLIGGVLNGRHLILQFNSLRICVIAVNLGFLLSLSISGRLDLLNAVVASLFANGVTMVLALIFAHGLIKDYRNFDRILVRPLLRFGIDGHLGSIASLVNERGDQFLLAVFLSSTQLGLYVVATTLTSFPLLLGSALSLAAAPNIARLRDARRSIATIQGLSVATLCSSVVFAIPIWLFAPFLLDLFFGHSFVLAATAARILAMATCFLALNAVLSGALVGLGYPRVISVAQVLALLLTLFGLPPMVGRFGIEGAATISLMSYAIGSMVLIVSVASVLEIPIRTLVLPQYWQIRWIANFVSGVRFERKELR